MKCFGFSIVLVIFMTLSVSDVSSQGIIVEAALRRILENFRQIMRNGNPETGFPVIAPYFNEDLFINASLGGLVDFDVRMTPIHIEGLDAFVGRLGVDLSNLRFPFEFRYDDEIIINGFYDMNGRLYGLIPIFGVGNVFIRPKGVLATGWATIVDNGEGMLALSDFSLSLMIDSLDTNIEGMLLGGELSDLLNVVIQDIVPSFLRNFPEGVTNLLTAFVKPLANRFLATRSMEDLLRLLFPRGT
ncbi:uncharacterized protein LOC131683782 [Topomyia yanbarensis]|uniref:uncharacterized protein LOC131683782 n=1 Tax=Topomyia yanbarensis TaxID=2498891 RepID=UPI00273ADCFF|nr:uncharacterized protein LOC131683782 [Topomyia yanbarensis]